MIIISSRGLVTWNHIIVYKLLFSYGLVRMDTPLLANNKRISIHQLFSGTESCLQDL